MASRPPKKPALTLDASLVQDDVPMMVIPKIFVGSIHSAFNLDCMLDFGITHILNASRLPVTFPKHFTYLSVEIRDRGVSNILSCIPTTNIFIEAGIDNGGVLVHCFGGKSRSPAFIAAYLMSSYNWSFDRAYAVIKDARSVIDINPGFECQLRAYAAANYDVYVAQQLLLRSRIRELHELRGQDMVLSGDCKVSEHVGYSQAITATSKYNDYLASNVNIPPATESGDVRNGTTVKKLAELKDARVEPRNDAESPNLKFGATAATYDAIAVNTEHEHFNSTGQKRAFSHDQKSNISPASHTEDKCDEDDMEMDTDYHEERTIQNLAAAAHASQSGSRPNSRMQPMAVVTGDITPIPADHREDEQMENAFGNYSASPNTIASAMTMEYPVNSSMEGTAMNDGHAVVPTTSTTVTFSDSPAVKIDRYDNSGGRTSRHSKSNGGGRGRRGRKGSGSTNEVEIRTPMCRLSRPGSSWVRVIPPLRGLERELKCSWCNTTLFTFANIIRPNLDILHLLNNFHSKCEEETNGPAIAATVGGNSFADTFMNGGLQLNTRIQADVSYNIDSSADGKDKLKTNDRIATGRSPKSVQLPPVLNNSSSNSRPSSVRGEARIYFADNEITPRRADQLLLRGEEDKRVQLSNSKESPPEPPALTTDTLVIKESGTHLPPIQGGRSANHYHQYSQVQQPIPHHPNQQQDLSENEYHANVLSSRSVEMELDNGNVPNMLRSHSTIPKFEETNDAPAANMHRPLPRTHSSGLRTSRAGQSKGFDFDIPMVQDADEQRGEKVSDERQQIEERLYPASSSGSRPTSANKSFEGFNGSITPQARGFALNKSSQPMLDSFSEDSPRVTIPPHRLNEKIPFTLRPQSAERHRWLARMNLLREGDVKLVKMAEEDDKASETTAGSEKYFHIEYLDWMGTEIFDTSKDLGDLNCFHCKNVLGTWTWKPTEKMSLNGRLEAPLFRIHKHVVHHGEVIFDATPSSTPRPEDMMASSVSYPSVSRSTSNA